MKAAEELGQRIGVSAACRALNVSRATFYRRRNPETETRLRPKPARALSNPERKEVLSQLNSDRFADQSPRQVYAKLLDEGQYLCSVRTMYRILEDNQLLCERRNQRTHPTYRKPELLASGPNEVWSWDITKLKGPQKWTYYYLYTILDIYSRYTVGWMLAHRESADLAKKLIRESLDKQNVQEDQLIIHSDRGPSMTSHSVAHLLASLGVTKSHSRPHVSNDNPFSESQYKTLKYRPDFPSRFGCYEDALSHCRSFFHWYNEEHYHSGIGLLTPSSLHHGQAASIHQSRKQVLDLAWQRHPERFVHGCPRRAEVPAAVWINRPKSSNQPADTPHPKEEAPQANCPGASMATSLTHPRSDYPSAGCVPAEPASVSPDDATIQNKTSLNTRVMPQKIPGVRGLAPDCIL
ncbi:IS3 family transposase [Bacillus mycoides]|uniref:IS3 family transposase n=1 Tax=Bacillus mycoides TaxID=1405 RepID=UPI003D649BAB